MRVVMVWRDNTDYAREVINWLEELSRKTGKEVESIDPDSMEGGSFVSIYDVVEYPTILALDNAGSVLAMWRGTPLPMIDEVAYYAAEKKET